MPTADLPVPGTLPTTIGVRGARHNNLRDGAASTVFLAVIAGIRPSTES
jgi:hypothetical protein